MTDTTGDKPFPGFPGFPPAEMLDKMWDMMRLTPFGSAFPGFTPGTAQGFGSPLSAVSDMMSPLMNVEELDKRITDMRAVEQWLKLNLNMLQSAIQALEVQRATLSTLRAFGAFAQESMKQAAQGASKESDPKEEPAPSPWASVFAAASPSADESAQAPAGEASAQANEAQQAAPEAGPFDPSAWWNMLQSQFNQLAAFAMTQPGATGDNPGSGGAADTSGNKRAKSGTSSAAGESRATSPKATTSSKTAPKQAKAQAASGATPRKTGAKRTGSSTASSHEK